jgi:hypothetical protein
MQSDLFYCIVALHISGVTALSSGVIKTVTAASGTGHNIGTAASLQRGQMWPRWRTVALPVPVPVPEVAVTVFSTPDDGLATPETCRLALQ